ncbi:MAG: glycosyltransferase [Candidatus Omnitrophota bacterium]
MTRHSISFVIPMFNEREAIEDSIEEVRIIAKALTDDYEIIISDDASTDGSGDIARRMSEKDANIHVVGMRENTKFGGALAAGLKRAVKDIVIYTDADLPVSLLDIKKSLPMIEKADIVTATSMIKKGENLKRKIISWGYNTLLQVLFRIRIKDVNSGYKIFRREVLEGMNLISKSPFVDAEIFINAKRKRAVIAEYPLIFRSRRQGASKIARLSVIAGTFSDMLRFRFKLPDKS